MEFSHLIIGVGFFAVAIFWLAKSLVKNSFSKKAARYGGSAIVVGLALFSDSAWVYGISTFVVATLITNIEFLEKLAALAYGRKEYWDYRLQMDKATPSELRQKQEIEASELQRFSQGESVSEIRFKSATISNVEDFEMKALNAISSSDSPLPAGQFKRHIKIHRGPISQVIDAVLDTIDTDYLVEIKYIKNPSHLERTLAQLEYLKELYKEYLATTRINKMVVAILVIPNELEVDSEVHGVPIIKFDSEGELITNRAAVAEVLEHQ